MALIDTQVKRSLNTNTCVYLINCDNPLEVALSLMCAIIFSRMVAIFVDLGILPTHVQVDPNSVLSNIKQTDLFISLANIDFMR